MNCPNCGTPGLTREIKQCRSCGAGFATEDLVELERLSFLLEETEGWQVPEELRSPYARRLEELRARLVPGGAVAARPAAAPPREKAATPVAATPPAPAPAASTAQAAAALSQERVPFDQWLLSERNIRIALYSGAVLLVVAGLIFVGVNWGRLSGPVKFATMLAVTGLMYLGGYLLLRRPTLRTGGIAVLAIASGFIVADVAIIQVYVLRGAGLPDKVMWLIGSVVCLVPYWATAFWTRADLFSYLGLGALVSGAAAALSVAGAPHLAYLPAMALLAHAILWLSRRVQHSRVADFTLLPTRAVSLGGTGVVALASAVFWAMDTGCTLCPRGSPWWPVLALAVGALFCVTVDLLFRWLAARWAAAVLLAAAAATALIESGAGAAARDGVMLALALAYLVSGYLLQRRAGRRAAGWPCYAVAYAIALIVTVSAILDPRLLDKVLYADVLLAVVSAAIHRDYQWIYGAGWLLLLPVYITIRRQVPSFVYQGLLMGLLGLIYAAAGYALGRRSLRLGGSFLSAAAFLSVVVPALTWGDAPISSLVLGAVAALYVAAARWQKRPWILVPALLAAQLLVAQVNDSCVDGWHVMARTLTSSYAALGLPLAVGGLALRRKGRQRWSWPLLGAAGLDLTGAYAASLFLGTPMAMGFSAAMAVLLLTLAWVERQELAEHRWPPLLTYLGIAAATIGFFFVMKAAGFHLDEAWPPFAAGWCALLVVLGWLLRRQTADAVYGPPLRGSGLVLMALPLAGAAVLARARTPGLFPWKMLPAVVLAITFVIAAVAYGADGWRRRAVWEIYVAAGAAVVALWGVWMAAGIEEAQAYVFPAGIVALGIGWSERGRGHRLSYQICLEAGLAALMGSAFIQSLGKGDWPYALLLLAESLAAVGFGVVKHLKRCVQTGVVALVANGIAQLGPAFVQLSGWLILGLTGSILLALGLTALLKREAILKARAQLTQEWRHWEP